jgi:mRNA interferase HigB
MDMVVISQKAIHDFALKYPLSADPLNRWVKNVNQANWNTFAEVKESFSTTDYIGNDRYVFDIGGNKFRLVAMIHFSIRTLYIRFIGTHAQYTELSKKNLLSKI